MPLEDEGQALSTLGQPLVSADNPPVVTPQSIQPLLNGFSQGYQNTTGVLANPADVAVAAADARRQQLALTPDIIQAQKAAMDLQSKQVQAQSANIDYGPMLAAYAKYGNPPVFTKDRAGNTVRNYQAEAATGAKYIQYENMVSYATDGLTPRKPEGEQEVDPKTGRSVTVWRNRLGENISPSTTSNPNPVYDQYQDYRHEALDFLFHGGNSPNHPASLNVEPVNDAVKSGAPLPVVAPAPPSPAFSSWQSGLQPPVSNPADSQEVAGWLVGSGVLPASSAASMSPQDLIDTYKNFQQKLGDINSRPITPSMVAPVTINTPSHTVTVQPNTPQPQVQPGIPGAVFRDPGPLGTAPEIDKRMTDDVGYKDWLEHASAINKLRSITAAYANEKPGAVSTQRDIDLANTVRRLSAPGSSGASRTMQEFSANSLTESQALLDRYANATNLGRELTKKEAFSPATRQRIIEEGNLAAKSLEDTARPAVKNAVDLYNTAGINPFVRGDKGGPYLDSRHQALLAATPEPTTSAPEPTTSGGRKQVTLKSGKTVWVGQ